LRPSFYLSSGDGGKANMMAVFINIMITFNLTVIPLYGFYRYRNNDPQKITSLLFQYGQSFWVLNTLYLLLFAAYKRSNIADAFMLLANSLNVKFIIVTFIINILIVSYFIIKNQLKIIWNVQHVTKLFFVFFILLVISVFLVDASLRYNEMYGTIPFELLLFHMKMPTTSAHWNVVRHFIIKPILDTVVIGALCFIVCFIQSIKIGKTRIGIILILSGLLPVVGIVFLFFNLKVPDYINSLKEKPSNFYEQHYIDPKNITVSFPERKRNLVVIFIESLETGFFTVFSENLMPEIASLAENGINFSQNDALGGANQLYGTGWTIAGITANYTGVPLTLSFMMGGRESKYGQLGNDFMPGAYGIGDILSDAGYKNYFIIGSDAEFGGRDKYFKTHKDTVIFDYPYFRDNGYIPDDYRVWWGFEDRKLYQFAKTKLSEISKNKEPFFLTLLTVDTHHADGYLDEYAERKYSSKYKNVLSDMSRQLHDFVEWIKLQDFYENTTVVILGDHLYHDSTFFPSEFRNDFYVRRPLNIFINSFMEQKYAKNREFSHFDMYPALIDSIGGTYDAAGFGLGRSMNKGERTLIERLGIDYVNQNLAIKSKLYNSLFQKDSS
jgi:phosphoglycerol transferase